MAVVTRKQLSNSKIFKEVLTNPRKPNSAGFNNFEIYEDEGMTFKEFIKAGGVGKHLRWDLKRGYVRIEPIKEGE